MQHGADYLLSNGKLKQQKTIHCQCGVPNQLNRRQHSHSKKQLAQTVPVVYLTSVLGGHSTDDDKYQTFWVVQQQRNSQKNNVLKVFVHRFIAQFVLKRILNQNFGSVFWAKQLQGKTPQQQRVRSRWKKTLQEKHTL